MKKHFREDKIDLNLEIKFKSLLFLLFFIFSEISAQIPINGFGQYKSQKILPNYNSVFALNFNNDSFNDLIILKNNDSRYLSLKGNKENGFDNPIVHNSPIIISKFRKFLIHNKKKEKIYGFISRSNRIGGLLNFNKNGEVKLGMLYQFNSYPDNIEVADINNDGKPEMLISGSSFNGLSLLYKDKDELAEKKIISKSNFTKAIFVNLNNDNLTDIVAYNLINGSLFFFFNKGDGQFHLERIEKLSGDIQSLKNYDLNNDGFEDIILSEKHSMSIWWGDSVSSYESITNYNLSIDPTKIIFGDYNNDEKTDVAFLDQNNSSISVLFAKKEKEFYGEIKYLEKSGLTDFISLRNNKLNRIISVSNKGYIHILSKISVEDNNKINLSIGGTPSSLFPFDYKSDGVKDLAFYNYNNNSINFLIRNKEGIPTLFYSYSLFEKHNKIFVDDNLESKKIFYCYTINERSVEIISVDFKENGIMRNSLYVKGNIKSIKIRKDKFNNNQIYIAYLKNNQLGFSINTLTNFRVQSSDYFHLADSVSNTRLSIKNDFSLFFWQKKGGSVKLKEISLNNFSPTPILLYDFKLKNVEINSQFVGDIFFNGIDEYLTTLNLNGKSKILLTSDNKVLMLNNVSDGIKFNIEDQIFFNRNHLTKKNDIYFYLRNDNLLTKLNLNIKDKTYDLLPVAKINNGTNFFIDNSIYINSSVFYIDKINEVISIRELKNEIN